MNTEFGIFIAVFVMVILPITFILWSIGRRFDDHDEEIMELKNRLNEIENRENKKD